MNEPLVGLEGVDVYSDDVTVGGKDMIASAGHTGEKRRHVSCSRWIGKINNLCHQKQHYINKSK